MKNKAIYAAATLALGLGLTACDVDHNDLRLEPPTSYTLEAPQGADQLMTFGATGSNVDNVLEIKTINPYNLATNVDFQVQVAKSEEAFTTWDNLVSQAIQGGNDSGDYNFKDNDGLPYVVTIGNIYLSPEFTLPGADFCDGVNEIYGFTSEDEIETVPVAFRVHAWVPGVDYSSIFSNVVELKQVKSYIPLREPRKLYLIGQPQGWSIDSGDMYATETEIGSNIYKGTFSVGAGKFQFRFYSELGDWDANSIGAQEEDEPVDVEFTDDSYNGNIVVGGKGSWQNNAWEGGTVDVTIDLNEDTIEMVAHEGSDKPVPTGNVLYLVGEPQGWNISSSDMFASETSSGSKIFKGIFEIPAGKFMFRFYSELGDWDKNSVGSQDEDNPVEISLADGPYTGDVVAYNEAEGILGKGSWSDPSWEGGVIQVVINLNDNTISISEYSETNKIYIIGACQGWDINSDSMYVEETESGSNVFTNTVSIDAGNFTFRFYTALGDWETNSLGSLEDGADADFDMSVPYTGPVYEGKGKWHDPNWAGGDVKITLDLNSMEVTFE